MKNKIKGSISIIILIMGLAAGLTLAAVAILTATQFSLSTRKKAGSEALNLAEAGINYYQWHLTHNPEDYYDGTGEPGVYQHDIDDPQGGTHGQFELRITPPADGSTVTTVLATGIASTTPPLKRTIMAKYGVPSLASYAFLHNSNVWFGHGMTIYGPVFSNGGIRQDGVNTSTMQTRKATYTCGIESGCDPAEEKPGIWGSGGPQELWSFPVLDVDFNDIVVDFGMMKQAADGQGLLLPSSEAQGYHVVFVADGTFQLYKVTNTDFYKGWSFDYLCENLYQVIKNETLLGTYEVDENPIIYIEDMVWVEGTLKGKTTLVAAKLPIDTYPKNIWIPNNLVYLDRSGDNKLGLIAQNDIAFAKDVPDYFEVDGALLAQSGRVLRHHYNYQTCKQGNPAMKNQLTIFGSVISNLIAYWNFSGGGGEQPTSGFVKRELIYDPALFYEPPPYFPSSGQTTLISWNEVNNP